MQTFVPYGSNFKDNARVLDRQRLGKQRVEGLQIIRTLLGLSDGWRNHPAVRMWDGHVEALGSYTLHICNEWVSRGYADTCADKVSALLPHINPDITMPDSMVILPSWIDDPIIMLSHRSNLVRKKPGLYGLVWPEVPNDIPYKWPV